MDGTGNILIEILETSVYNPAQENFKIFFADDMTTIKAKKSDGTIIPFDSNSGIKQVYTASLNQSGVNDPTATIFENNLSGSIVWTRDGVGNYTGTLTGAFTDTKSFIMFSIGYQNLSPLNQAVEYSAGFNDEDSLFISVATRDNTTGATTLQDGFLFNTLIKIFVYN